MEKTKHAKATAEKKAIRDYAFGALFIFKIKNKT